MMIPCQFTHARLMKINDSTFILKNSLKKYLGTLKIAHTKVNISSAGLLNGASQKGEITVNFHVGETVTSLQRATLIPGGSEALLYATVSGSLGVLLPFTSREDHDFFQHLEMHMRSENSPLCGRDHLSFRSYYYPVKVS